MLFLSRNESATMSGSNILMMSRLASTYLPPPVPAWCRCRSEASSTISYFVNAARSAAALAEEAHDGAAGTQHPDDLPGERLRGGLVEIVEEIPAQDAVHASVLVTEPGLERGGKLRKRTGARVPVVVAEEVLDEHLAAEAIAEERDVPADHRTEGR